MKNCAYQQHLQTTTNASQPHEMFKAFIALLILLVVCWVIQLLPVIAVPFTPPDANIYLSYYDNYKFGVFGICNVERHICSKPSIGYPSTNSTFYAYDNEDSFGTGGIVLPSDVRYTISKLLVVHVVAFCFSSLLLIVIFGLITILFFKYIKTKKELEGIQLSDTLHDTTIQTEEEENNDNANNNNQGASLTINKTIFDLTPFLNLMLVFTFFSVLTTLLAFLADILLFTPNLSYLGWLQLIPIVLMALVTSMLCFIKRSISSRKFFESEYRYANDDMRIMRKTYVDDFWNDNASDDGFYVYTDGFYTRNGDDVQQPTSNTAGSLLSEHNDDSIVAPRDFISNDDSRRGSSPHEFIELQNLRPT